TPLEELGDRFVQRPVRGVLVDALDERGRKLHGKRHEALSAVALELLAAAQCVRALRVTVGRSGFPELVLQPRGVQALELGPLHRHAVLPTRWWPGAWRRCRR